jgi:epoxyqueuosine reductase
MARKPLEEQIRERARQAGFDLVGITRAEVPEAVSREVEAFVAAGLHGTMTWMADTLPRRLQPRAMWPDARSAIVCAMNYGPPPGLDPLQRAARRNRGNISVYALGRDYHDVVKGRLKNVAQWVASRTGRQVKVFVDTAPLLEKPLAVQAGIGWAGRHTCVLSRQFGNWLFLGVILTEAELRPDAPATAHCGRCRACLDVCPTGALMDAHRIDARRCISYLTIEHRGPIARDLRPLMGNRIFGCDDCLAVCPWNRFACPASEERLRPRPELVDPPLAELAALDDTAFRRLFAGTPVRRAGRERFVANVMIAIGNSGSLALADAARKALDDEAPLVRAMAVWALSRLLPVEDLRELSRKFLPGEKDPLVREEWILALRAGSARLDDDLTSTLLPEDANE